MSTNKPIVLMDKVLVTGPSTHITSIEGKSFQAVLTGSTGALSCTVDIEVSNDAKHFVVAKTITLSVASWSTTADDATDAFLSESIGAYSYVRSNVSAISGTDAAVSVNVGR